MFWWLLGFDMLIAIVVLGFFVGLMDGSVSSFNMGIWMNLLMLTLGIPVLGYWLNNNDYQHLAKIFLGIIAAPGLIFLVFMLIMLIAKPKWQ